MAALPQVGSAAPRGGIEDRETLVSSRGWVSCQMMTDEFTPEAPAAPAFPSALRGYDRAAVDAHVRELQARLRAAEAELEDAGNGPDGTAVDQEAVKRELEAVGSEVAAILDAARLAADNMRARAAEDAARWRADADRGARDMRESAETATQAARGDAWETSAEMLDQASHESAALLESARQDALYIRAEAEREAVRLTGDARRDAEEAVRAGRGEAERLVANAQAEAQTTLENAGRSAELAQERARALERRRGELMEELELARRSIGEVEEGQAPPAGVPPVVPLAESVEPMPAPDKSPTDWLDHDASVKIVPAAKLRAEEPVDADSFVAEVEQLRAAPPPPPEPAPVTAGGEWLDALDESEDESRDRSEDDVMPLADTAPADLGDEAEGPTDTESPAVMFPVDDGPEADDKPAEVAAPFEPAPAEAAEAAEAAAPAEPGPEPEDGDLDSLFATLREPEPDTAPTELGPEVAEEAAVPPAAWIDSSPDPAAQPVLAVESGAVIDPFDLKERMLLPIENRALRALKRRIVDLQNRVLEELRMGDEGWQPDRALFAASIGDEVAMLTQESYVAGYAAAAELLGEPATPPPDHAADQESTAEFVDGALGATSEALDRARATGGGARQVSAAVSRVFRAWRTDEAERRLRRLGALAYHSGILDALSGLGVTEVAAIAEGTPCGACPAGTGLVWRPADELPAGTALPPAMAGCTATIVPAATD